MRRLARGDGGVLLVLLFLLVVEAGLGVAGHRSEDELLAVLEGEAGAHETIAAVHALANRDQPRELGDRMVRKMLRSPHPEVQEFAMTTNVTRLTGPRMQGLHRRTLPDSSAAFRCEFFARYHEHLLTREVLARYHESLP